SHQATHDALTGLPNRVLFLERLVAAIPAATDRAHLAVLFCDLDRFKEVNDTLGHAAGTSCSVRWPRGCAASSAPVTRWGG
ncbi:MAG TPA: diguanylate cyclase, partial [Blastococcus sp.]